MTTVNQALEINRVEEPIARAFRDHIGEHVAPYVDITLMNVRGNHDEVVRRIPEGHGEFREESTPVYSVSMYVLYRVLENTKIENYVGVYEFFYPTDADSEDIYQAAFDSMIDGDRLISTTIKYIEGELDDGA